MCMCMQNKSRCLYSNTQAKVERVRGPNPQILFFTTWKISGLAHFQTRKQKLYKQKLIKQLVYADEGPFLFFSEKEKKKKKREI